MGFTFIGSSSGLYGVSLINVRFFIFFLPEPSRECERGEGKRFASEWSRGAPQFSTVEMLSIGRRCLSIIPSLAGRSKIRGLALMTADRILFFLALSGKEFYVEKRYPPPKKKEMFPFRYQGYEGDRAALPIGRSVSMFRENPRENRNMADGFPFFRTLICSIAVYRALIGIRLIPALLDSF